MYLNQEPLPAGYDMARRLCDKIREPLRGCFILTNNLLSASEMIRSVFSLAG